jgi:hypothetical protein
VSKILIFQIGIIMNFYYFCIMKNWARYFAICVVAILMIRCANVVTPSGGPKDDKSPVVLEASPENNSTDFNGKTIHLTFDEFVTLNNPSNNVMISPPMNKKPTYRTSGKTLIIRFEEPLKPNTTYSINFGDAVKDLHEGNVFKGYTFNFSTGNIIDSLSLKGKVISASSLTPMEGFVIGLYSNDNETITIDSMPYKLKPEYITTTDKKGDFEFSGLADKDYLVFALKDNNSNLIYDLPNEEIAFYQDLVKPYYIENQIVKVAANDTLNNDSIVAADSIFEIKKPDYPSYTLYSFVQEDSVQKIFKKELVEEGLLRFVFRYPADNVEIKVLEELPDTFNILPVYSARKDTILWYFTPCKDSLWISINDGVNISDTTHYSLKPRKSVSKRRRNQEEETVKRLVIKNNLKGNKLKPEQPLVFTFNEPIVKVNQPDSMHFEKLDEFGLKYQIINNLKTENKYQITIPDSVFFGISGVSNDSIKLNFSVQEESAFGNIYITAEVPENIPQVIIELTTDNGKTIDKQIITGTQELSFEYLDPGKYKLKAILDLDRNGVWSPGNFNKKLQPEKIIFYNGTLEVRANWDIDLDEPWKIEK